MTLRVLLFFSIISQFNFGQTNTEIFLYDIEANNNSITVSNGENISNNEGYDNQPSFLNDERLLYSSTRNGQTDIAQYFINYNSKVWINFTEGGEYSPQKIPNKSEVSAVRLDTDGKQRLYRYNLSNGESTTLINDLVVAYYTWSNDNTIVSAVIENENLNLFSTNINSGTSRKYATNIGRSFHEIPGSNLVSFISKENNEQWQIKSINPSTGETKLIANTISGVEDICWLNSKTILSGKDAKLYKLTLEKDNNWKEIADLSSLGITSITRLAVNPSMTKLAIAGSISVESQTNETSTQNEETETIETPAESKSEVSDIEAIVQRNLDAYNARDIDAFMKDYADDIKLYTYPNTLRTEGKETMRKGYKDWFDRTPDLRAFIKQRIVIGNKVIDEEQVTANGQIFNAVAIYEVENGLITTVTFIQN
ncbi:nuclear transport factor 2 family protein [Winogradskyella alexanderae]|uniref:Nuclear transport factor 2 family protein n=1 Tax=Winogradskyella alexanderae TaxID=2877123 RepID=A0ABS7XQZ2_9FLAO|nr:nuclear transport factor 2 family protein [Winogradskyella alexanderae]MCA0132180.1 nuclear transport factor 2 family protein [Winogradskyella alexanderae]